MADKLEIQIIARDEASAAFKEVQKSASEAGSGLTATSKNMTDFGGKAATVGGVMSLGVTAPLLMLGKSSGDAASDMAESSSKMEVVFGPVSGQIAEFADGAAVNLGMSEQKALEAAGTFGNLFTALGLGQQPAADMSKGVLQLSSDLGSFNNMEPGIVLEKLRAGLTGEFEPLKSLGIAMSAATVETKAMEMGLAGTAAELTESDKIAARYALVMEQTATAQGDFARTADGLANSQRIQKAESEDLQAELGQNLLPVMKEITTVTRDVMKAFNGLSPELKTGIIVVGGLLAVVGPVATAVGAVTGAIGFLLPAFVGLAGFIGTTAIPAAGALILALGPVLVPIGLIALAIGALALAWSTNFGGIQEKTGLVIGVLKGLFQGFLDAAGPIWDNVQKKVGEVIAELGKIFEGFRDTAGPIWEGVSGAVKTAVNAIIGSINGLIGAWNALEFKIPGFSIELPSAEIMGQKIGGGTLGWEGLTVSTPDLGAIPLLASGGNIMRGGLAVVGDAGPELLHLPTGASVAPLGGGGGNLAREIGQEVARALGTRDLVLMLDGREIGRTSLNYILGVQRGNVTVGIG